ncbi:hypothetical protein B0I27_105194 [Arcticibacter pallidicorallinus]|uniref:Uncharacterized protein n=1 Tax=Arcticibacter pallidicorallinus TaxID=1259464 RepID=A0A2T0U478_9SPHI|nr:hypothetical protein B0I27_105194 [Arcticibacter pallidicorallinus]
MDVFTGFFDLLHLFVPVWKVLRAPTWARTRDQKIMSPLDSSFCFEKNRAFQLTEANLRLFLGKVKNRFVDFMTF